jgi:glycosyltransferase involved in cell wall biosynthesis
LKNVLMLTYAFFPVFHGGVPRVAKFCKYLSEYGWNPVLVAADMRGDTVHARTSEKDPCEAFRVKNPGRLKRPRTALGRKLRFLRRNIEDIPMDGLEEAMYRQAAQLLRERPFDAIFASSLPQFIHRIARRLSRESGIPWVADHRDIIGQDGGFGFYKSLSLLHRLIYPLEFLTTVARDTRYDRHASAIVTVSEGLAGRLRRRTLRRVDVVMNGFDEEDYRDIPRTDGNDRLTVVYTGSLWGERRPDAFFRGIAAALDRYPEMADGLRVDFYGPCCVPLERAIASGELPALDGVVRLMGTVPTEEAKRTQCAADVLYLISHPCRGIATGKIYEYLAAGKTILSVPGDGDITDEILRESGLGRVARTADEVCGAIREMYLEWKERGRLSPTPNRENILRFSRRSEAGQLAEILNRVISGKKGPKT